MFSFKNIILIPLGKSHAHENRPNLRLIGHETLSFQAGHHQEFIGKTRKLQSPITSQEKLLYSTLQTNIIKTI